MRKLKFKMIYQGSMPTKAEIKHMIGERILHRTSVALDNPKGSAADLSEFDDPDYLAADHDNATLVTSLLPNGNHMPVIDIDHECMLVPSSTPGRFHLYINKEVTKKDYFSVLNALVHAGIVEPGYYAHSLRRRRTFVRYPGVTKHNEAHRIEDTR